MKIFNVDFKSLLVYLLVFLFSIILSCNTVNDETVLDNFKGKGVIVGQVKKWYEINAKSTLLLAESENFKNQNDLIFESSEIRIDWQSAQDYNFPDGRKVYEFQFQSESGIFPAEFIDRNYKTRENFYSERILFIQNKVNDFEILLFRLYTMDSDQEGVLTDITYQRIPDNWTGRLDVFSYNERHLKSYKFEEGVLRSTLIYKRENESTKSSNNTNKLVACSGSWVTRPIWMGIEAIYEINCQIIPESGGYTPPNNTSSPYHPGSSYGGGYYPSGGGGSSSGQGCTPTDNTNHFQDPENCTPPPNWENPEDRRKQQLNYLRLHGASQFVSLIEEMLSTPGILVKDVWEINLLVNQVYERQRGLFMMAIFSPENVALLLGNLFANPNLTSIARNKSFFIFSRYSNSVTQPIYKTFSGSNFRHNLIQRTGINSSSHQAHHVFPQTSEFSAFFSSKGINVHNPNYGAWWSTVSHQHNSHTYNHMWRQWIAANPNATSSQVIEFARQVMEYFKTAILF